MSSGDDLLNFLRGGGNAGEGNTHQSPMLTIIVLLSIIIHILDAATSYRSHGTTIIGYILIIVLIVGPMYHFRKPDSEEMSFLMAVAAAYGLPFLLKIVPDSKWMLIVSAALFLFPIIALYIAIQFKGGKAATLSMWWITFWVVVLMLYLVVIVNPAITAVSLKGDTFAGVKYVFKSVGEIFSKTWKSITGGIKKAIAQATGEPYDGQEESRVGIYLEDVKPLESKYNANTDIYIEAKIKAYNVKEMINVNTICYVDGGKGGIVDPTMIYGVTANYENMIGCDLGKLVPGTYTVKVRINFEFETSSDIAYTFVNSNIKSDQYERLNIDSKTMATYTGGPVELGLPSLTQPLRIETNPQINSQISTYPFGVSLKNLWPQGKVVRGKRYMLNVPSEISLIDCSRDAIPSEDSGLNIDGRNIYVFEINSSNAGDTFDAVRCRMNFDNVKSLLGNDLKSVKTFAARARYEYAIEGSTIVTVDKI